MQLPDHIQRFRRDTDADRVIQTHSSWVLLAGDHAYKFKKPLDFGFMDFRTLEARRINSQRELRLNRRLAASTYQDVLPVMADGQIVDYAVQMRRLPDTGMLAEVLPTGGLTFSRIREIALTLAQFHAGCEHDPDRAVEFGGPEALSQNWDENFRQAPPSPEGPLRPEVQSPIRDFVSAYLQEESALIRARLPWVRRCHGDLRVDSICFAPELVIFDCLEFNERFAWGDTASELAFLAMDLASRGHQKDALALAALYGAAAHDPEFWLPYRYYLCYRAFVRGKVDTFLADQPGDEPLRRAAWDKAERHFVQAAEYAANDVRAPAPLVVMMGTTGCGKSLVTHALAARTGSVVLTSDLIRKRLAGLAPTEDATEIAYTDAITHATYDTLAQEAKAYLLAGRSVILDATHLTADRRATSLQIARDCGYAPMIIEVTTTEERVRENLKVRAGDPTAASDGRWEVYLRQREEREAVSGNENARHIEVDLAGGLWAAVETALA